MRLTISDIGTKRTIKKPTFYFLSSDDLDR